MPAQVVRRQCHEALLEEQARRVPDRGEHDGGHRHRQLRVQCEDQVGSGEQQAQRGTEPFSPPRRDEPAGQRVAGEHSEGGESEEEPRVAGCIRDEKGFAADDEAVGHPQSEIHVTAWRVGP